MCLISLKLPQTNNQYPVQKMGINKSQQCVFVLGYFKMSENMSVQRFFLQCHMITPQF